MPYYVKKPVVIEAVLWDGSNVDEVLGLCETVGSVRRDEARTSHALFIDTAEGTMRADRGDWIIKGVKSELYPCKPDIFEATYSQTSRAAFELQRKERQ